MKDFTLAMTLRVFHSHLKVTPPFDRNCHLIFLNFQICHISSESNTAPSETKHSQLRGAI